MTQQAVAEHTLDDAQEQALLERIHAGELIEDMEELTPRYRAILERTLEIAAQSEVTVLTWAYTAFRVAPDIGAKVAICGTIQDEVGHAHQQGMLFERFGFDMQKVAFEADPRKYWSLPIMEFPVRNYAEFVVSQAFLDRAGRFTTWDIELNCSFAPYRRTLKKVNFEEAYHFRHGAMWTEFYYNQNDETKKLVDDAVRWIFPWGYHWYGRPDDLKGYPDQLNYKVRAWSNDTMRNKWLRSATDFADRVGLKVPAEKDEETGEYRITDMPYPMTFDAASHDWEWEETSWDRAIGNFKSGGPMRPSCYERLQREEWGDQLW